MSPLYSENDGTIRITREQANDPHVDDLLRRQASLRGETGIARDRGRKWYYQNWFIFGLAGLMAAIGGWALIEPYFDDFSYIQGQVTSVGPLSPGGFQDPSGKIDPNSLVEIQTEQYRIVALNVTQWIRPDGSYAPISAEPIKPGDRLGFHVEPAVGQDGNLFGVANYVERDPPPLPPEKARRSLRDMERTKGLSALLLFPTIAAAVGLFIGAADGLMCRLPRRLLLAGAIGLLVGFIGGFISTIFANILYSPISTFAAKQGGGWGFSLQTGGRGLAWCVAGMAMGLGQGLAMRSGRLLLYGFLGGMLGGLLGGLFFDPIDFVIKGQSPSAHWSRLVGFAVIGLTVGVLIGVVELLARDAWLRMVEGPLAGKEFLMFKDVMRMGSSPRNELYLFNDPSVAPHHASIRATGDTYEIENVARERPVQVNGRPVQRARLRHGDRISVGQTSFIFQRQHGGQS